MKTTSRPLVLLVDSSALIHRAYHALPASMITAQGELTNAVYGFTTALFHALETYKPDTVICCFDVKGGTFRNTEYDQYKAHRKPIEEALVNQFPRIKEIVQSLGIPIVEKEGFEADDCIGTLAKEYEKDANVLILTGDKDELQLISETTKVILLKQGIKETVTVDLAGLHALYGLTPDEFIVFKALRGDPSDNIPGVSGIGEKTAGTLVQTYHTLDSLYDALNDAQDKHPLLKGKVRQNLIDEKHMAELSLKLSAIDRDVALDTIPKVGHQATLQLDGVHKLFDELEFRSLIPRLLALTGAGEVVRDESFAVSKLSSAAFIQSLLSLKNPLKIAFAFAYSGRDVRTGALKAIAYSVDGKAGVGALWDASMVESLEKQFKNDDVLKIIWDVKSSNHLFAPHDLSVGEHYFDSNIVDSLLQTRGETGGPFLHKDQPDDELLQITMSAACRLFTMHETQQKALHEAKMESVWSDVEKPLTPVLLTMEQAGILIHETTLSKLSVSMETELAQLQKEIWHLAGQEFNVASPQQISMILFEKLQLQVAGAKKKATGFSTNAATLDGLRDAHPIVDKILRYREVAKLKSTYVEALPKLIDEHDKRLHTTYGQIGAATGRISSNDPNLQNIPARTELGQEIRACFIADRGKKLLSVDYSQFELRILAHLSGDKEMQASFAAGIDIHLATAAKLNGVALDAVTKTMRRNAKAVNFGILYGLSAHSLSKTLETDFKTASEFIDRYFALYPKVKQFLKSVVEQSTQHGFYTTLLGRRRNFPELTSSVWAVKQAGERMAMNFPMQGSQADLLKLAMVRVATSLAKAHLPITLLLTVHDELVFEVAEDCVDQALSLIRPAMEEVYELAVPIIVTAKVGDNWSDMQDIS